MSEKKTYKINWYELDFKNDERGVPVINPYVFSSKNTIKLLRETNVPAMERPVEVLTFSRVEGDRVLTPWYLANSVRNTLDKGYFVMPISLDKKSPKDFKAEHLPFKQIKEDIIPTIKDLYENTQHKHRLRQFRHLRDVIIPKLKKNLDKYKLNGFFLMEGDVIVFPKFDEIQKQIETVDKPIWLGYKKIMRAKGSPLGIDYVVGAFFLYFPRNSIEFLIKLVENQKRDIYSDRFFTQMVQRGELLLPRQAKLKYPAVSYFGFTKSIADEIAHDSAVARGKRGGLDIQPLQQFPILEGKFTEPKKFIESNRKMTDLLEVKERIGKPVFRREEASAAGERKSQAKASFEEKLILKEISPTELLDIKKEVEKKVVKEKGKPKTPTEKKEVKKEVVKEVKKEVAKEVKKKLNFNIIKKTDPKKLSKEAEDLLKFIEASDISQKARKQMRVRIFPN